jgi:hypothetical protein
MINWGLARVSIAAVVLSGCQGASLWGNLAVFGVSVGIFLSTLALGQGGHGG